MLDALRNLTGSKEREEQIDQLESLLATARQERASINTMLDALITRGVRMAPLTKSIDEAVAKADAVSTRLEKVTESLNTLESRSHELRGLDKWISSLKDVVRQAEQTAQKTLGPDSELKKHREAIQLLSEQAAQAQAVVASLAESKPVMETLRGQLRASDIDLKQALAKADSLKSELDQVRAVSTTLQRDYAAIRESSRASREQSDAALATVAEIETRVAPLAELNAQTLDTEERLTALNALSEHVTRKVKTLESQQQAVERAVVQANRVNEMVWAMDVQINKLNEGMKQTARVEDTITRIETLSDDAAARMKTAEKLHQDVRIEASKIEKESTVILDTVRTELASLDGRKQELETFDERMRALQSQVGGAEQRIEALAAQDRTVVALTQKIDNLSQCFEVLFVQADDLTKQQLALDPLREQLAEVDGLAKKAAWQMDALRQSHQDLDVLRGEIQRFYTSHAEIAKLADKLEADRRSLDAFSERLNAFQAETPRFDTKMDAILGKLTLVEDGTQKAERLRESIGELDAQVTRFNSRVPFVEKLEERLNGLHVLSTGVDRRLEEQLSRQAELETLKATCDGLGQQTTDAQHKLDAVRRLQNSLVPLVADVEKIRTDLAGVEQRLSASQFTQAATADQEKRYADLVAASRTAADQVAERSRQMQALADELGRATTIKDEMLIELDRVQSRQRDTVSHIRASEDLLVRAENMFKQFEQSAQQLAFGERKLSVVDARLAEIKQLVTEVDRNITVLNSREQIINAVKSEVENVHQISARSKADLTHVLEHRNDVATLKARVDVLLTKIGETDERIVAIDAHRKTVDEVEAKANGVAHLLDDVRLNLEALSEQKVVVDHVSSHLDNTLQEARNMVRTLQQEREMAQRIERGIKQLRGRATDAASFQRNEPAAAPLELVHTANDR